MKKIALFFVVLLSCQPGDADVQQVNANQWNLPLDAYEELLALCDTASLLTFAAFENRINRIQDIFAAHNDPRGAFPTVYKAITTAALASLGEGMYQDPEYSNKFALDFSKRYLYYLEHHLRGDPLEPHWELYYRHAQEGAHITRLVLEGINAHLTLDLTNALADTRVPLDFRDDWILFGDVTVLSVPDFLEELENEYHTDASYAFGVFFVGDFLDQFLGEGATVNWGFNLLRIDAFNNAIALQDPEKRPAVQARMWDHFWEREAILEILDNMEMTPRMGL